MHLRYVGVLAAVLGFAVAARAQDAQAPAAAQQEFNKLYTELKGIITQLSQLKEQYRTDASADKPALEAKYNDLLADGRVLNEKLAAAAEKAYLEAPNKDNTVGDFLYEHLRNLVSGDDYTAADKLLKILIDNKFERKFFDHFAGLTYFATSDFDKAAEHLERAVKNEETDETGKRYLTAAATEKTKWAREQKTREAEDAADDLPKVKLSTTKGDIVLLLFENEAPNTVKNFIQLVEKKFYDGLIFHRVLPGFMAQGGDPKGDGSGGPGYTIHDEVRQENHRDHFRGSLSMAKTSAPNTGGSQFFITFLPTPHLDGLHTVFGRVIEGQDVVSKLQRYQPGDSATPDKITSATVLRKREHAYEPLKTPDRK